MLSILSDKPRDWFKWALINFLLAGVLGVLLRLAFVVELDWMDYRNILHAHSHVAVLGWAFLGVFCLLVDRLKLDKEALRPFKSLFWLTQLSVLGMFLSFSFTGYHFSSIFFSTCHSILAYLFIWKYWRELNSSKEHSYPTVIFLKSGLGFFVLSTLSIWLMPLIILFDWRHEPIYYISVQFYLHFQFNGWLIFVCLGLLFQYLVYKGYKLDEKLLKDFFRMLFVSCFLTFALAVTWTNPISILFYINSAGVLVQLLALIYFIRILIKSGISWSFRRNNYAWLFLKIAILSFGVKILIQTAVVIPEIGTIAYTIRNFVLGFLHLMLIGMISFIIIGISFSKSWIPSNGNRVNLGVVSLLAGFVLTELILFLHGILIWVRIGFLPFYYELILIASILLPVGILLLLAQRNDNSNSSEPTRI